jgi:uncharacterized coiled-coil DUF342 family protein
MIRDVEVNLVELKEDLRKIITDLEGEKAALLDEIAEIRDKLNAKVTTLKSEVDDLRKEKEMLQELIGSESEVEE